MVGSPAVSAHLGSDPGPVPTAATLGELLGLAPAQVKAGYPRLADFQALAHTYDPQGKFRNAFLDTYLFD